jgi:Holliday junction resolvase RusA-like endonuclease
MLTIVFPVLPPSSNRIYFRGTSLTRHAREYAEAFAAYAAQHHLHEINKLNPNGIYAFHLRFFFETLVTSSWNNPAVTPSKRAKDRYKRLDLDNRIKLLTDCVRDAIDIDDSRVFAGSQEKHMDPGNPRVEIYVQEVNPDDFGIPPIMATGMSG